MNPHEAKLKLIHNGKVVTNTFATNLTFVAKEPGAYRLEAWLEVDGEDRPWIYSNPVYLKEFSLASLRLPSNELSESVEARKDITYVAGKPEDEASTNSIFIDRRRSNPSRSFCSYTAARGLPEIGIFTGRSATGLPRKAF